MAAKDFFGGHLPGCVVIASASHAVHAAETANVILAREQDHECGGSDRCQGDAFHR
jgi:hypothetical protein